MAKRFINPNWKELRKLNENLRQCFFYCWDKADQIGVYEFDGVYLKADLGFEISFQQLLTLPQVKRAGPDKIIFLDFIIVNYGQLKENYNPHKPAFRDLEKNSLSLNSSFTQACPKLEDEEEDKEEDVTKGVKGGNAKSVYTQCVDLYFEFFKRINEGEVPKFDKSHGENLKSIITHLTKTVKHKSAGLSPPEQDAEVVRSFRYILDNWRNLSEFTQKQTDIRNINSNFNRIITELKNKSNGINDSRSNGKPIPEKNISAGGFGKL